MVFEVTEPSLPSAREGSESVLAGQVLFARWLTQRDLVPKSVAFPFGEPYHASAHRALFGCPVHFGAARTEIVWPRAVLGHVVPAADRELEALFRGRLQLSLSSLKTKELKLHDQIRGLISEALERGEATLDAIAKQLYLSRRSLQRRLSESGTSFQELLDESRRELSFRALRDLATPIEEVAFALGYSEPSAFHRAFRRWTGTTPARWRSGVNQDLF